MKQSKKQTDCKHYQWLFHCALTARAGYNAQIQLRYNDPPSSTENYTWSTICHFLCYSSDPLLAAVRVHRSLKLSHSSSLLYPKSALFRKVSCLSRPCLISESWFHILSNSYVSNIFIVIYKQIFSQVSVLSSVFQFSPPCRASFSLLMPPNYFNLKKNYKQLQHCDAATPRPLTPHLKQKTPFYRRSWLTPSLSFQFLQGFDAGHVGGLTELPATAGGHYVQVSVRPSKLKMRQTSD